MKITSCATIEELKQHLEFSFPFAIPDPEELQLDVVENDTDLNARKRRDAEVLCCAAANCGGDILEIGTSFGHATFQLARNAPDRIVHTVNILPEQYTGGDSVTHLISKEEIGSFYRGRGVGNVVQLYADTLTWETPSSLRRLGCVFIDGCHDEAFVHSDSRKFAPLLRPGGLLLWHDFNPELRSRHGWIQSAMTGVERFLRDTDPEAEIFHLKDSWVGVYRIPKRTSTPVATLSRPGFQPAVAERVSVKSMKDLKYVIGILAHSQERLEEEERQISRIRELGYDVDSVCVSVPGPGHAHWSFEKLDAEYKRRNPDLLRVYEDLARRLQAADVFISWSGANLHPDFIRQLGTFNVYICADDPDSSNLLSRPVAPSFDFAFTRNIACVQDYRDWGCRHAEWLFPPATPELMDPGLTAEKILSENRTHDIVLFCERTSGISDRAQRVERLAAEFPAAHIRGRGWPGGYTGPAEILQAYRQARIGWNLHNSLGPTNSRLMSLPAMGILQICDNKSNLGRIFELDKEVVGFDSLKECADKTRYYLAHERERREIAAAGFRRVHRDYTEARQWEALLRHIEPVYREKEAARSGHAPAPNQAAAPVKLHLGCGNEYWPGYVNIDRDANAKTDLRMDMAEIGSKFPAGSVAEIALMHSLNYLNLWQARDFFATCKRLLRPDGVLTLETVNLEKAVARIQGSDRDLVAHLEGVRALHAFGLDQIDRRETFFTNAFSWTPWHLALELRRAGFFEVAVARPETHAAWRDMRVMARNSTSVLVPVPVPEAETPAPSAPPEIRGHVLFLMDSQLGHTTVQVRGRMFEDPLASRGWRTQFLDMRKARPEQIMVAARGSDIVYLLKVASLELVRAIRRESAAKLVFDLTDALWKPVHREAGWQHLEEILSLCDAVFSENEHICAFGRKHSAHVIPIPACSQVDRFEAFRRRIPPRNDGRIRLGWMGSTGTVQALLGILPALERLGEKHENLELRIVGCSEPERLPRFKYLRFSCVPSYDEDAMIAEILNMDIGLFPPPSDAEDYAVRGSLKALLYMSGGIPPVCLNAGDCARFIRDDETGMLVNSPEEWFTKIDVLIRDSGRRLRMGAAAAQAVRGEHSLGPVTDVLAQAFAAVLEKVPAPAR